MPGSPDGPPAAAPFEERARRKQRDALIRREFCLGRRDVTVDPARLMSGLSDDLEAAVAGWRERLPDLADAAAPRHNGYRWQVGC